MEGWGGGGGLNLNWKSSYKIDSSRTRFDELNDTITKPKILNFACLVYMNEVYWTSVWSKAAGWLATMPAQLLTT